MNHFILYYLGLFGNKSTLQKGKEGQQEDGSEERNNEGREGEEEERSGEGRREGN